MLEKRRNRGRGDLLLRLWRDHLAILHLDLSNPEASMMRHMTMSYLACLCVSGAVLCVSAHFASADGGRSVEVKFQRVGLSPSTSIEVSASARYVIVSTPAKGEAAADEVVSTFRQDAAEKLMASGGARPLDKDERIAFAFSPPEPGAEEVAGVEIPVRYTISMLMPDGSTKAMTKEATFVLPDRDRRAPLATCLRVQEFPGANVRIGLAPCGQAWLTP